MGHEIIKAIARIKGRIIPIALAVVVFLSVSPSTFSQPIVDQSNTGSNDWYACLTDGQVIGQSFTAGQSGTLSRIEIDFFINPCPLLNQYEFTVDILEGNGFSGPVLATKSVTVSIPFARSMLSVNFFIGPQITAGQIYTIRATPLGNQICQIFPGPPMNVCAVWFESQNDSYSGGISFLNGTQDNVYDKYFLTYISSQSPCESISTDTIIASGSYTWIDGNTYTTSNTTATFMLTNMAGCDSLVTLNLTIVPCQSSSTNTVTACSSYTWIDGNTYTSSNNTATFMLTNMAGCDSLVTLNLTITTQPIVDQSNTGSNDWYTCLMDSQVLGQSFTAGKSGILSVIEIDFFINPCPLLNQFNFKVEILDGNGYSGAVLATKNVTVSIPFARSMLSVNFPNAPHINAGQVYTIRATPLGNQVCTTFSGTPISVCAVWFESQNDSYPAGIQYINGTQDNIYDKYFLTHVLESATSTIDVVTACNSYTWIDGNTYTASNNTATFMLTSMAGCDSLVILNLTIKSTSAIDVVSACNSYTWIDGNTYTTSNSTATFTLVNAAGCDSLVTLNLTIKESTSAIDVVSACNSYIWIDGNTYTTSNSTATFSLTNAVGCDSLVTLNLTIKESTSAIDVVSACHSYTWIDGNTYTTSNNAAQFTLTNKAGCDSLVTLHLTIVTFDIGVTTSSTLTANANEASYQWFNCDTNESIEDAIDRSFSPPSSGTYKVEIELDGCVGVSDCIPMTVTGVSKEQIADVLVYPNPTAGTITLHIPDNLAGTELRLMNAMGQTLVQRAIVGSRTIELGIEGGAGLYFVELKAMDGAITLLKVLKK